MTRFSLAIFLISCIVTTTSCGQSRQVKSNTRKQIEAEKEQAKKEIEEAAARENGAAFHFYDKAEIDIGTGTYGRFVTYEFGKVQQGDMVVHEYKFKNSGNEVLLIENALASCGCTVPEFSRDPIQPGEEGVIKVSFNTTGLKGHQNKTITINSNAKINPKVLNLRGFIEVFGPAK